MSMVFQAQVLRLVCEGVLEKCPGLKVALIEGGFAWLPALMWRLDKNYRGLRGEVPWLTNLPGANIRGHFRATTRPMEEPEDPRQLLVSWSLLTGARTEILPMRICPPIKSSTAALIITGALI